MKKVPPANDKTPGPETGISLIVDGMVSRIVPGRLLYVQTDFSPEVIAITPDRVKFLHSDGQLFPYKGEPFCQVGLQPGALVHLACRPGEQAGDVQHMPLEDILKMADLIKPREKATVRVLDRVLQPFQALMDNFGAGRGLRARK